MDQNDMIRKFALNMIANNPNVNGNPNAKAGVDAIRNGDNAAGEQIAMNICKSYGKTPEEMLAEARKFFGI